MIEFIGICFIALVLIAMLLFVVSSTWTAIGIRKKPDTHIWDELAKDLGKKPDEPLEVPQDKFFAWCKSKGR